LKTPEQNSFRTWLRFPTAWPFALAGVIGVSLGACTVSVGDGEPGSFDFDAGRTDTSAPPITTPPTTDAGNLACNSCLFQGCSGQHAVCQGSAECLAIYQCATKAGCDQACVNQCFDAHPTGQAEYTALYTCDQARTCSSACAAACNATQCPTPTPDAGETPDAAPLDCSGCTKLRCANEQGACAAGSDCDAFSSCVIACGDAACTEKCQTDHAIGKAASDALASCTGAQCKTECGF